MSELAFTYPVLFVLSLYSTKIKYQNWIFVKLLQAYMIYDLLN